MNGPENPHVIAEEMGDWMTDNVTVIRENGKLRETETRLQELSERWHRIGLTDRSGYSNREIAQALFVTLRTVEMHLSNAFRKLGVSSRTQLAGALAPNEAAVVGSAT